MSEQCPTPEYHETHRYCPSCDWREETPAGTPVEPPYYEVTVRLPLHLYSEHWFDAVGDAAGEQAAVSGSIIPAGQVPS